MAYESKVTRQGRTTIPKPLRDKYGIFEGDTVSYVDLGDHMAILPVPKEPVKVLTGLGIGAKESVDEMRKESLESARRLVDKKFKGRF
jgi:AbrB family looped-hinge helix DNA binding protein